MAGLTPYVIPSILINAPTGISWGTMPIPGSTAFEQLRTQQDMCMRATASAEAFLNMQIRATIDVQTEAVPSRECSIDQYNGTVRFTASHFPVLAIVAAQTSSASVIPRVWNTVDVTKAEVEDLSSVNTGSIITGGDAQNGNTILFDPSVVSWWNGKRGTRLQVTYLNGFPHAGITSAVSTLDSTIHVDDVSGWGIATVSAPIIAPIYDGADSEIVTVTGATATNSTVGAAAFGPGTLTLAADCTYNHVGPTDGVPACLITTMPATIQRAVILMAVHEALVRGATATTVQKQPGTAQQTGSHDLYLEACELLLPFRRVV